LRCIKFFNPNLGEEEDEFSSKFCCKAYGGLCLLPSLVQHQNSVVVDDGVDAVRNCEHRDFREFLGYRLLYQGIFKEKRGRGGVNNILYFKISRNKSKLPVSKSTAAVASSITKT